MLPRSIRASALILFFGMLISACNLPTATPTSILAPSPLDAPKTGDTAIYTDLSRIIYVGEDSEPFWMYETMVTNQQYALCVATGACTPPDTNANPAYENTFLGGLPATGVGFEQAQAYCQWMNGALPTRAQLELAKGSVELPPNPCAGASFCNVSLGMAQDFRDGNSVPLQFNYGEQGFPAAVQFSDLQTASTDALVYAETAFNCVVKEPGYFMPTCTMHPAYPDDADFPAPVCVEAPVIKQINQFCEQDIPHALVEISSDGFYENDPWNVLSPGFDCAQDDVNSTAEKIRIICSGPPASEFEIWGLSRCEAPAPVSLEQQCLEGYELGGTFPTCIYQGPPADGVCPAGFTKPADMNCCAPVKDYPSICPAGQIFWDISGECEKYSNIVLPASGIVNLGTCSGGPTSTATPTPVAAPSPPGFTLTKNAFCRMGPDISFADFDAITTGQTVDILNVSQDGFWYFVFWKQNNVKCWVTISAGQVNGSLEGVTVLIGPPTPTPPPGPIVPPGPSETPTGKP